MGTSRFKQLTIILLLALGLSACGGGGSSGLAGIGGTGITATGKITGFGSIFVNGVEYFIQSGTTIMVNGVAAQESDLKLGMVVTLSGTLNNDGVTGTVDNVAYKAELKGPITNIDPNGPDPDGKIKILVVLGKSIIVNSTNTSFEGSYSYASIAPNDIVEVSGFVINNNGTLQATRIENDGVGAGSGTPVEVKGTITAFPLTNSFILDGVLTVNFDPTGNNTDLIMAGNIDIGNAVEIKGTFTDPTTIFANEIKPGDDGLPEDAEQVEIEGIIANFVSAGNFTISGQQVDASSAQLKLSPANLNLADGLLVEVEGPIVNGVLQAAAVNGRDSTVEIAAYVTAIPANNTIQLQITTNNTIDVIVDSNSTQLEDEAGTPPILSFGNISAGDFLAIEAYQDDNGDIIATQIKRLTGDDGEIILKGPVSSWSLPIGPSLSITILGITFISDALTSYQQDDQPFLSATQFAQALNAGDSVKVVDEIGQGSTTGDNIAEEMEIETD